MGTPCPCLFHTYFIYLLRFSFDRSAVFVWYFSHGWISIMWIGLPAGFNQQEKILPQIFRDPNAKSRSTIHRLVYCRLLLGSNHQHHQTALTLDVLRIWKNATRDIPCFKSGQQSWGQWSWGILVTTCRVEHVWTTRERPDFDRVFGPWLNRLGFNHEPSWFQPVLVYPRT